MEQRSPGKTETVVNYFYQKSLPSSTKQLQKEQKPGHRWRRNYTVDESLQQNTRGFSCW